jgi:hypothetical protein
MDGLLLWRAEHHHPPGVVDIARARAAAGGDRRAQRVLQNTVLEGGINPGLDDASGKVRCEDRIID